MNQREIGQLCENYVCRKLQEEGFTILTQNFRVGRSPELDIVARQDDTIHFIEVKARSKTTYGLPREAVSSAKMQRILKASELFTARYRTHALQRSYDVAEVYFSKLNETQLQIHKLELLYQVFGG